MDKHYYLISQLPMLFFGQKPTISVDRFLEESEKWLSRGEYNLLIRVNITDEVIYKHDPSCLRKYKLSESRFRKELAEWRKSRKSGQEYKPAGFSLSLVKEGNPLEIEKKLLHMRWKRVEEIEWGHDFDLTFVICYYLKLQLLEKYFEFDKEKGLRILRQIVLDVESENNVEEQK
jgi:hypothetical protein